MTCQTESPDAEALVSTRDPMTADDIARAILLTESHNDLVHAYINLKAFVLDQCKWGKSQSEFIARCDSACYDVIRLKHPDVE